MNGRLLSARHDQYRFAALVGTIRRPKHMSAAQASQLIRQTPPSRDRFKVFPVFEGHETRSKCVLAGSLRRIITLSLHCFNGWLKPLLVPSRKEPLSSVQDHDPYLESLLIALHDQK
jgi:hypothetical protein